MSTQAPKWRRRAAIAAVCLAIALVFWRYGNPPIGPFEGERAVDFSLETLSGDRVAYADLAGQPVFINFWATWCVPCLEEMPIIQQVYTEHPGAFAVVAVSDEPVEKIREYVEKYGYTFPIYVDRGGAMNRAYQITFLPTSVFIDSEGVVRGRHVGQMGRSDIRSYLERVGVKI